MKYPLKIFAKIVETSSKVVAVRLQIVDDEGNVIKEKYADSGKIEERIQELKEAVKYYEKLEKEVLELHTKGLIDVIEE